MSTNRGVDKENGTQTYSGILFSLKKEGNSAICNDMDEPGGHCAEVNKPVTERQI